MQKTYAVLNMLSVIVVIYVNYAAQFFKLNDTTISEMSNKYTNLFTPDGYAFAIWGIIYLGLIAYGLYQLRAVFFNKGSADAIIPTGGWFISANLLNCIWVVAFMYDYTGLSVLAMFGIVFSLIKIILNTNMERWDAPIGTIAFIWWPICLYSGWITVASIANVSAYLTKLGWEGGFLSETTWTVIMIIIASLLNLLLIKTRNMREFAMVGVWAIFAIYIRHKGSEVTIANVALIASILIFIAVAAHGYNNRKTNPYLKYKERFAKN